MSESSRRPDKSWTPEVDRLLRQLGPTAAPASSVPSGSAPAAPTPAAPLGTVPPRATTPGRRSARSPAGSRSRMARPITLPSRGGVWSRVALGLMLSAAMTQWPYRVCGLPLAGYLGAAVVVMIAGAWTAHGAWRARMGRAHILAIAVVFAGASFAALQVLPRVDGRPAAATWRCIR